MKWINNLNLKALRLTVVTRENLLYLHAVAPDCQHLLILHGLKAAPEMRIEDRSTYEIGIAHETDVANMPASPGTHVRPIDYVGMRLRSGVVSLTAFVREEGALAFDAISASIRLLPDCKIAMSEDVQKALTRERLLVPTVPTGTVPTGGGA